MLRALRQAVLAQLQTPIASGGLGYDINNSGEGPPDGQPPPGAGAFYISVHGDSHDSQQDSTCQEDYTISLTVSMRIDVPWDSIGRALIEKFASGLNDRCEAIKAMMVNQQYTIMNAANAIINKQPNGPWDGFVEPLLRVSLDNDTKFEGGTWFHAEDDSCAAAIRVIRCSGAKRIQAIGNVQ